MSDLTASEARTISFRNYEHSELYNNFIFWVRLQAQQGHFDGNFFTDGKHFDDIEYEIITKKLGYNLDWNSECLWYEVSWR